MVRMGAFAVGGLFLLAILAAVFTTPLKNEPNVMYSFVEKPRHLDLASDGVFGRFSNNQAQLQRGLQVYKEVCAACHGIGLVSFRNLVDLGYSEDQVKAFAKEFQVASLNPDTGEPTTRPGLPFDRFPSPYPNDIAAQAANNGAVPPDLSLIVKARGGGKDYLYSLLTGYVDPPANLPKELQPGPGLNYNPYFPNLNLAMMAPLNPDQVTYADGTKATVSQMSADVTAFLVWTAEPKLEQRHIAGWAAVLFLLIFTVLAYLSYRTVWADKKH